MEGLRKWMRLISVAALAILTSRVALAGYPIPCDEPITPKDEQVDDQYIAEPKTPRLIVWTEIPGGEDVLRARAMRDRRGAVSWQNYTLSERRDVSAPCTAACLFNLPATQTGFAINMWLNEANLVGSYWMDEVPTVTTNSVFGCYEPLEALRLMFARTDAADVIRQSVFAGWKGHGGLGLYYLNVPSKSAPKALLEVGNQAGLRMKFSDKEIAKLESRPIKGFYTFQGAISAMLGDQWWAEFADNTSVSVVSAQQLAAERRRAWWRGVLAKIWKKRLEADLAEIVIASNRSTDMPGTLSEPRATYDRSDFQVAPVAFTLEDLASTIPQVWGGGPNEYSEIGREGATNPNNGTGINYRSLGADSTLLVLDDERLPRSGTEAGYTDISLIPLAAIDHLEIIDGGANRYGLDAIAGVAKIETRHDFVGAETQAQFGTTTDGGGTERRVSQLLGTRLAAGSASLILEYYNRDPILAADRGQATSDLVRWGGTNWNSPFGYPGTLMAPNGQRWAITGVSGGKPLLGALGTSNNYDTWQSRDILPWQQRLSALANASISLTDNTRLWSGFMVSDRHSTDLYGTVDGQVISIPSTNPGYLNPLGGTSPIYVEYGYSNLLGPITSDSAALSANASAGVVMEMQGWKVEISGQGGLERDRLLLGGLANPAMLEQALSSTDPAAVLNPFLPRSAVSQSVLTGITQVNDYRSYSRMQSVDANATRSRRLDWAEEDVAVSIGGQFREEALTSFDSTFPALWQSAKRGIGSIYANLDLPLIGRAQEIPLIERLGMSVGGRYEHYTNGESMISPSVLLAWSPISSLTLRGTFRGGFRPSSLTETNTAENISEIFALPDGRMALAVKGGNPNLTAERTRTWTGGGGFQAVRKPVARCYILPDGER